MSTRHFVGISGSLRRGSFNTALLAAASELTPEHSKLEIASIGQLPMFNPDLERDETPAQVEQFRATLRNADGLVIATPEYNYSITPALKNAIDWASRGPNSPINGMPAVIMGAGGRFGTLRAQMHLRQILSHNALRVVARPEIYVDRAREHFDDDGRLISERFRDQISRVLHRLADIVDQQQAAA